MLSTIKRYQNSFNSLTGKLKENKSILAAMAFGSIITGDLWEESDIDLFVICKNKIKGIRDIYTEEKGVSVHIKLMSKDKFLELNKEEISGGFIHRVFSSSRLIFSKDHEITSKYDVGRYYPDISREKWNSVYLGDLLKSIGVCKKYLTSNGIYMSYSVVIKCIENFSKLYINSSGYMISKDVMTMAMNLNDDLKKLVDSLFLANEEEVYGAIKDILNFFQVNIERNLKEYTNVLLSYMKEKDCFLSSEDMKKDEFFKNYHINFETILNKLVENNLIKKESRDYKDDFNNLLFKEKVYFI